MPISLNVVAWLFAIALFIHIAEKLGTAYVGARFFGLI